MGNSGGPFGTRRQAMLANRFGLLVVLLMAFSAVFSVAGDPSPVAVAQQECADGEALNNDTGECEAAGEVAPPDCAEGEVLNPFTGLCESAVDAAPPDCAEDDVLNEDTGDCEPVVDAPQPGCAEDEVLNEDTGACEPTGEAAPPDCADGETPNPFTGACETDATDTDLVPPDEPAGSIDISTFACPSGFSGESSNADDFGSMCTDAMSGVPFEAYDSVGFVGGGSTDSGGRLQISEIGAGRVSIVEAIPAGSGAPYVFCASGDDPTSLGGFEGYDVIDGSYATIDFGSAAYYACSWYTIPEDDGDGVITITKSDRQ